MRNLSLRLACVFIILIFLLAPLGAVDFNQDNNTKYINQDDETNIATEDANVTVDDVDDVDDVDMGYCSAENGYFTFSFDSEDLTLGTHEITVHAFSK